MNKSLRDGSLLIALAAVCTGAIMYIQNTWEGQSLKKTATSTTLMLCAVFSFSSGVMKALSKWLDPQPTGGSFGSSIRSLGSSNEEREESEQIFNPRM